MSKIYEMQKVFSDYELFDTGGGFISGVKVVSNVAVEIHENGINVYLDESNESLMDKETYDREFEEGDFTSFIELHSMYSHMLPPLEASEMVYRYLTEEEVNELIIESDKFMKMFYE